MYYMQKLLLTVKALTALAFQLIINNTNELYLFHGGR